MRLLPLAVLLLVACKPPPTPGEIERTGTVFKTVNGVNVTDGMVDATLAQLPPGTRDKVVAMGQMDQVKEQVVIGELLYQEALKQKLHEKPAVKQTIAMAERDALAKTLLDQVITERTTDEKIQAWYNDHLVQFHRPQVKARHVLVKDQAEADAILAEVKANPAQFSAIATAKSVDAGSAKEGGDLGWFEQGRMVKEFGDAAFAAEKGAIIGPVATKFGFHIIAIDDKRDAIPVEEVSDKIKGQLRNEVIEAYLDELKKGATIAEIGAAGGATVSPASTDADKGAGGVQVKKLDGPPPGMQGGAPPAKDK